MGDVTNMDLSEIQKDCHSRANYMVTLEMHMSSRALGASPCVFRLSLFPFSSATGCPNLRCPKVPLASIYHGPFLRHKPPISNERAGRGYLYLG